MIISKWVGVVLKKESLVSTRVSISMLWLSSGEGLWGNVEQRNKRKLHSDANYLRMCTLWLLCIFTDVFFCLPRLYWVSALWDHSSLDTWHAPVHRRKLHALCNQSIKEYNLVWFALTPCLFSRWAVVVLKRTSGQFTECKKILNKGWWVSVPLILRPAADFTKRWDWSYLELGWVTRPNLGLILRSACLQCRVGTRPKS